MRGRITFRNIIGFMTRLSLAIAFLIAVAAGCGDSGTPPEFGGEYVVTLVPPSGAQDGAAVIELNGAGIENVTALDAQLFTERSGNRTRVVVVRDVAGALRFGVTLARGSTLPQASILEVADGSDVLRVSVTGYTVKFTR